MVKIYQLMSNGLSISKITFNNLQICNKFINIINFMLINTLEEAM